MNPRFIAFYICFFAIYGLINYYIALRGWQALSNYSIPITGYWGLFVAVGSLSFPLGRWAADILPRELVQFLIYIGSYWMGIMYYLFLIIFCLDLVRLLDRFLGFLPEGLKSPHPGVALVLLLLILLLNIYGTWNALHPVIRNYEVNITQKHSSMDTLNVIMVSDIHLGWIVGPKRLEQLVHDLNLLNPDLILLPGDIIDEGVDLRTEKDIPRLFGQLNPRLGTYAIPGNHEYISGSGDDVFDFLSRAGIKVLRDQWIEVEDGFYLVGRDSRAKHSFGGVSRLDLHALMHGIDVSRLPIILMDHEPFDLGEAAQADVALQFSGHTHHGQISPNQFITRSIYELDWGYLRKDNLQVFVSCGFGTWGPPIRIGNHPEILNIKVNFTQ